MDLSADNVICLGVFCIRHAKLFTDICKKVHRTIPAELLWTSTYWDCGCLVGDDNDVISAQVVYAKDEADT